MQDGWFPPIVCQDSKIIMSGCTKAFCVKRARERANCASTMAFCLYLAGGSLLRNHNNIVRCKAIFL